MLHPTTRTVSDSTTTRTSSIAHLDDHHFDFNKTYSCYLQKVEILSRKNETDYLTYERIKRTKTSKTIVKTILREMENHQLNISKKTIQALCLLLRTISSTEPFFLKKDEVVLKKIKLDHSIFVIPEEESVHVYILPSKKNKKKFEIFRGGQVSVTKAVSVVFTKQQKKGSKQNSGDLKQKNEEFNDVSVQLVAKLSTKLKDPKKSKSENDKARGNFIRRVSLMQKLDRDPEADRFFPITYHYLKYKTDVKKAVIFQELADGDLIQAINELEDLPERIKLIICYNLIQAVQYLHKKGIVHCDLKPENVLYFVRRNELPQKAEETSQITKQEDLIEFVTKITDFGLACVKNDPILKEDRGSPYWCPPEMIKNIYSLNPERMSYTEAVDIYSLGLVLDALYFKKHPDCILLVKELTEVSHKLLQTKRSLKQTSERESVKMHIQITKVRAQEFEKELFLDLWKKAMSEFPRKTYQIDTFKKLLIAMQQPLPERRINAGAAAQLLLSIIQQLKQ